MCRSQWLRNLTTLRLEALARVAPLKIRKPGSFPDFGVGRGCAALNAVANRRKLL